MKLIKEVVEHVDFLTEEKDGVKKLFITGPFIQTEVPNRNKRIYRAEHVEREVNRYITEKINNRCAYGELGHPATPNINLDRVAIHIKEMKRDGNNFIGKALVASTPMGDIVRGLHNDGAKLGVSSRGLGSLKDIDGGLSEVQSDYHLATPADVVAEPSAPDAYVQGIVEGREYIFNSATGTFSEQVVDAHKKAIPMLTVEQIEERKEEWLHQYLLHLANRNL